MPVTPSAAAPQPTPRPADAERPPPVLPQHPLLNRRLQLLIHALRGRTTGGGLRAFLRNLSSPPCRMLAKRHIAGVKHACGMRAVYLAGHSAPLFYPGGADMAMLYQVLAEQLETWAWHRYEVPETRVQPGDVVLDCGASEGLFTLLVHGRAERVYAFEPLPEFRASLARTFAAAGNVEVVPVALGARAGRAYLYRAGISSVLTDEPTDECIDVVCIDDFCRARGVRPTYIKADLEGYEMRVLEGARGTLAAHKPRLAITTYHRPTDAADLAALVRKARPDYQIRFKGIEHVWGRPLMLHAW